MKFYETSFEDYIKSVEEYNFNDKNKSLISNLQCEFTRVIKSNNIWTVGNREI